MSEYVKSGAFLESARARGIPLAANYGFGGFNAVLHIGKYIP